MSFCSAVTTAFDNGAVADDFDVAATLVPFLTAISTFTGVPDD